MMGAMTVTKGSVANLGFVPCGGVSIGRDLYGWSVGRQPSWSVDNEKPDDVGDNTRQCVRFVVAGLAVMASCDQWQTCYVIHPGF